MTTEEKLKHFQDICMTDARERSARMLDDYMNALEAVSYTHLISTSRRGKSSVSSLPLRRYVMDWEQVD